MTANRSGEPRPTRASTILSGIISGYDDRSAIVIAILSGCALITMPGWLRFLSVVRPDVLLVAVWSLMGALMAYRVVPRRDVRLAIVALVGGAFIETWGTRTGLWTYFNHEKPPLFILPAWPAAALSTERIALWLAERTRTLRLGRAGWLVVWLAVVAGVLALLVPWTAPAYRHPLSWIAALMVLVPLVSPTDRHIDVCRILAGAVLGFLLERWGTTRGCWTYWSGGLPPPAAVVAHGIATIAFARGTALLLRLRRTRELGPAAFAVDLRDPA
jgi:uncharacterized membrane protein YoaT (DUF817 family)